MGILCLAVVVALLVPRVQAAMEANRKLSMDDLEDLGCWADNVQDRALDDLYLNSREEDRDLWDTYPNVDHVILRCAQNAIDEQADHAPYQCFGVQFYGECWSSETACDDYMRHGKSVNCSATGWGDANRVYAIKPPPPDALMPPLTGSELCKGKCMGRRRWGQCPRHFYKAPQEQQSCMDNKVCCHKIVKSCQWKAPFWHCVDKRNGNRCPKYQRRAPRPFQDCGAGKLCCRPRRRYWIMHKLAQKLKNLLSRNALNKLNKQLAQKNKNKLGEKSQAPWKGGKKQ